MDSKVQLIVLTNGDKLVAQYSRDIDEVTLKKAVTLIITPKGVAMLPFPFPGCPDECKIYDVHVLTVVDPPEEVLNAYNEQYGSGLIIADRPLSPQFENELRVVEL